MLLNLTMACHFVQIEPNALLTPTTCLTYNQKSNPNVETLAFSFRAVYAGVQAGSKDRHG